MPTATATVLGKVCCSQAGCPALCLSEPPRGHRALELKRREWLEIATSTFIKRRVCREPPAALRPSGNGWGTSPHLQGGRSLSETPGGFGVCSQEGAGQMEVNWLPKMSPRQRLWAGRPLGVLGRGVVVAVIS